MLGFRHIRNFARCWINSSSSILSTPWAILLAPRTSTQNLTWTSLQGFDPRAPEATVAHQNYPKTWMIGTKYQKSPNESKIIWPNPIGQPWSSTTKKETCLNMSQPLWILKIFSWASLAGPSPGPGGISPACGRATTSLPTLRKASAKRSGGLPAWDRASRVAAPKITRSHCLGNMMKYVYIYDNNNNNYYYYYCYYDYYYCKSFIWFHLSFTNFKGVHSLPSLWFAILCLCSM